MAFHGDSIYWVEVEKIVENPYQPRREFDEARLQELAESVRMYGILQPLTVTRKEIQREDGTFYTQYELIAGERRLRASRLAGVAQVPVIIRDGEETEQEKLELAIIENLQREDLNAVDRALAFRQLADAFGLSHTQVAKKVGRSREYVSNSIRILALPETILSALRSGDISEGHARTLLMLAEKPEEQDVVFREILLKKLSVRETERISRKIATDKLRKREGNDFDDDIIEMEKRFTETLGTRVQIQKTDFGGRLTIDYFSVEDLEAMLERMRDEERERHAQAIAEQVGALRESTPLAVSTAAPAPEQSAAPESPLTEPEMSAKTVAEESRAGDTPMPSTNAAEPPEPHIAEERDSETTMPAVMATDSVPHDGPATTRSEDEAEAAPQSVAGREVFEAIAPEVPAEVSPAAPKPDDLAAPAAPSRESQPSPAAEQETAEAPAAAPDTKGPPAQNDLAAALQRALGGLGGSPASAPEHTPTPPTEPDAERAPAAATSPQNEAPDDAVADYPSVSTETPPSVQPPVQPTTGSEVVAASPQPQREYENRVESTAGAEAEDQATTPASDTEPATAAKSAADREEDADLYSIRNFSI